MTKKKPATRKSKAAEAAAADADAAPPASSFIDFDTPDGGVVHIDREAIVAIETGAAHVKGNDTEETTTVHMVSGLALRVLCNADELAAWISANDGGEEAPDTFRSEAAKLAAGAQE